MQFDWKKILGALLSLGLGAGLALAAKNGIQISCPNPPASVNALSK